MAHCIDASTSSERDFNRGCTNDSGIFSGAVSNCSAIGGWRLIKQLPRWISSWTSTGAADYREGYSKYAYCSEGTADYCAGFSLGFGANSRSIRSDLSSVLNLAASSLFLPSLLWFQSWTNQ